MKLPTLYKEAKTGAIQEWTIEIDNNKFRTIAGQVGGQLTASEWTTCGAKNIGRANETTAYTQTGLEAKAKWQKKKDHGYVENLNLVGKATYFEPMLAHNYNDYKDKITFPVFSQPKLDGIRCICTSTGLWTRNGKRIVSCPHIFEALKPYLDRDPALVFDGELYSHQFKNDFNKIASLVKKLKPTDEDLEESKNLVEYWVYDLPSNVNFGARFFLFQPYKKYSAKPVRFVYTEIIQNQANLDILYNQYMKDGFEGQIIRLNEPYQNKRTKFLLKRKEWIDEEFEIVDICEGVGNKSDMAGFAIMKNKNGQVFKSNIKGTWEFCDQLLKEKDKVIGKLGTVKYQNLTPDGVPRFPYITSIRDYE